MQLRLKIWYKNLVPLKQLAILFFINGIIWFVFSLLTETLFFDEHHSLAYHVFDATWMAFFQITLFNWDKIKAVWKGKTQ